MISLLKVVVTKLSITIPTYAFVIVVSIMIPLMYLQAFIMKSLFWHVNILIWLQR